MKCEYCGKEKGIDKFDLSGWLDANTCDDCSGELKKDADLALECQKCTENRP